MGPRYRETCTRNLRLHLASLDDVPLRAMTPAVAREWYASAMRGSGGRTSIMQSYRLLRAVMSTAVRDGAIAANPCRIPGAGSDRAKERPVASPAQVVALVDAITERCRAAVLLAAWCGLRRGEVLGLLRADADLQAGTVTVRRNRVELLESPVAFDADPKTDAGKRTVAIHPHVLPLLAEHIANWAGDPRVFGRDGGPMRGDAIRQAFNRARLTADMPGFRHSRSAAHWPDPRGGHGRNDQGSDASARPCLASRSEPLPPHGRWPGRRDRLGAVRAGREW